MLLWIEIRDASGRRVFLFFFQILPRRSGTRGEASEKRKKANARRRGADLEPKQQQQQSKQTSFPHFFLPTLPFFSSGVNTQRAQHTASLHLAHSNGSELPCGMEEGEGFDETA